MERLVKTPKGKRLYEQERLILEATELLCKTMQERGIAAGQLAVRLGKGEHYVPRLLEGRGNVSLRSLSDAFVAMRCRICLSVQELAD